MQKDQNHKKLRKSLKHGKLGEKLSYEKAQIKDSKTQNSQKNF